MVAVRGDDPQGTTAFTDRSTLPGTQEGATVDNRDPGAYAGMSSEAARARERMDAARQQGGRDISARSRRIVGWTIALAILGFFVAAFAGWIDIFPG